MQYGERAAFPKGQAREDWTILRALSASLGKTLPYDDLPALRAKMIADHPTFGQVNYAPGALDAVDLTAFGAGRRRKRRTVFGDDPGLLPDQPDRARQPDDGGVLEIILGRAGRARARGGGVGRWAG